MTKRIIALFLMISMLLFVSCSQEVKTDESSVKVPEDKTQSSDIVLAYASNDTLSPYTAKSKSNQEIAVLMFDSLVNVTADYNIEKNLAKKIENNDLSYNVELINTNFTDGTRITAEDVVYSVNTIKSNPDCRYYETVEVINSCSAKDTTTVVFNLNRKCETFEYCLQFPIIKKGTADNVDEDNRSIPPVGCGRYTFVNDSGNYYLEANPQWHGKAFTNKRINLINLPDETAVSNAVQAGTINVYYSDLSGNTYPTFLGGSTYSIMRNNLVYLGIGIYSKLKSSRALRYAVNYAVDREDIAKNAYYSEAVAATGPYHSKFSMAQGLQTIATTAQREKAITQIESEGYTKNSEGFYEKNGSQLNLVIACNSESNSKIQVAQLISQYLTGVGIHNEVKQLDYDSYKASISSGSCDLYVGEIRLDSQFNLYSVFTAGGIITYSSNQLYYNNTTGNTTGNANTEDADISAITTDQNQKSALQAAYYYTTGESSMSEMLSCFNNEMPFIPLCHHNAITAVAGVATGLTPTEYDPLCGIENAVITPQKDL